MQLDTSAFADDKSVVDYLVQSLQQANPLIEKARAYQQYESEFQEWLRTRQQAAPQTAPQQPSANKAPEYDPSWEHLVRYSPEKGAFEALPGVDPGIVPKFLAWKKYQNEFNAKLAREGPAAFADDIRKIAEERAQELIQQRLEQMQVNNYTSSFEAQNASWLYQRDQFGNVLRDMSGQAVFSPHGRRFFQHVQRANQYGISNPLAKEEYARAMLAAEVAASQQQAAPAAPAQLTPEQIKQQALAQARGNYGGTTLPPSNPNVVAQPQNEKMDLRERLRQRFAQEGITDADFAGIR